MHITQPTSISQRQNWGQHVRIKNMLKVDQQESLPLVAVPGAPSSFLFLVVRPGAPSSVLAPSTDARSP